MKPTQPFSSKAICHTLRIVTRYFFKSEAMAAEADVEDFFVERDLCVCVSDVVVGHVP